KPPANPNYPSLSSECLLLPHIPTNHQYTIEIASTGIENHPRRNILLRAVGQSDILEVDVSEQYVESGSIFLLCTDGLWGCVEEEDILTIMMDSSDLQEACDNLTKEANRAGGLDNITSLIVKYDYGNSK
ncbi:MAG TPA: hypothetical protein QF606_07555, partial [Anaerolineales bacterium]|nr:hypothetical protein [Anaerolineales bacterium]